MQSYDFIIIGAGIVGLTIARELKYSSKSLRILIIEKEKEIGQSKVKVTRSAKVWEVCRVVDLAAERTISDT